MLNQPKNVKPSSFAGVGGDLINAAAGMTVSWEVSGTSPMTAYQLDFYANDAASTLLFSTGQITLAQPFYGTDGNGNVQRFSVDISAAVLAQNNIVNGNDDGYKFKIKQWWGTTSYTDQTSENWFIAQSPPVVSISTSGISAPDESITGTWSQAQGVGMDWARWQVYIYGISTDPAGGGLVHDTGVIHTQVLSYDRGGWMRNTTYYIVLSYQMQNGYQGQATAVLTAGWAQDVTTSSISITENSRDCAGILVDYAIPTIGYWDENSGGNPTDGYLEIGQGEQADFYAEYVQPFTRSKGAFAVCTVIGQSASALTFALKCDIYRAYSDVFLEASYSAGVLTVCLKSGGTAIAGTTRTYTIGTANDAGKMLKLVFDNAETGYGKGTWTFMLAEYDGYGYVNTRAVSVEAPYPATLIDLSGDGTPGNQFLLFSVSGDQALYFAGIAKGSVYPADMDIIKTYGSAGNVIEKNSRWLYCETFSFPFINSMGTFVGMETPADYTFRRILIYRNNVYNILNADLTMGKIFQLEADPNGYGLDADNYGKIVDYATVSGNRYEYWIMYLYDHDTGDGTETATITAYSMNVTLCPSAWNWNMITAKPDENGVYHMTGVYKFAMNVETAAMTNNNSPALMQNFTAYPARQGVSANYRTGSLTSYIGSVEDGTYVDTAEQAAAIQALSTDGSTKFLKSRKGECWMVDTSAPVSMKVGDKYKEQPYAVTLPWAEIGSMDGVSVISIPTDGAWNQ